jgi:hypothetical protein
LNPVPRYNLSMSRTAQEILEDARQLPPGEVNWLIENLLQQEKNDDTEAEIETAWDSEIKRRLDEIDSGAVELIPLDDVITRMDARILARQRG